MPRGPHLPPHAASRSSSARGLPPDILRETCPEDLHDPPPVTMEPAHPRPPGSLLLYGFPLALCFGVVLVGALHAALGMPLGEAWAGEVWSLAKTAITATMVYTPFAAYVQKKNDDQARLAQLYQGPSPSRSSHDLPLISIHPQHGRMTTGRYSVLPPGQADDRDRRDP